MTSAWDTAHLYSDDTAARRAACRLAEDSARFADRYRGRVRNLSAGEFALALRDYQGMHATLSRLGGYGTARVIAALDDAEAADLSASVDEVAGQVAARLSFLVTEWCAVPDGQALALCAAPELAAFRRVLLAARAEEPVAAEADDPMLAAREPAAVDAWAAMYDLITSQITVEGAGNVDQALARARSVDPAARRQAADGLYRALGERSAQLAHCLDTLVADRLAVDALTGATNPRSRRDSENGIAPALVDTALRVVSEHEAINTRWYAAKAAHLGTGTLDFADVTAAWDSAPPLGLDAARQTVKLAFGTARPELADLVDRMFTERRVDAEPRPYKIGGSLCVPCGSAPPYVLVNFTGEVADTLTLAHEIGHALHYTLAASAQGALGCDPPTLVGEVVAVFGELLAADQLRRTGAPGTPIVEAFLATVFRQAALTRFEDELYARRAAGEVLTDDRLNEAWLRQLRRCYGPAVRIDDRYGPGWALVPHYFRTRYYNYSYVLAALVALALHTRLRTDPAGAAGAFCRLLALGGTEPTTTQLTVLGIDPADERTWTTGQAELARLVDSVLTGVPALDSTP